MRIIVLLFLLLASGGAVAQTCTGGLGTPIVNITFGQGYDYGPELPNGTTSLTFVKNSCPNDGQYTIVSYSPSCFGATWLPMGSDHTGNQAGKYMIVNADYKPSDFFVQQVDGLCAGTSYQFSAWVLNLSTYPGQILPNITFQIENLDGTVLATFTTGDIPHANPYKWDQYAFYFNMPAGVSSVRLRMTNNAPGGNGNDFALDDITFRAAGPAVNISADGYATNDITVCDYNQQAMKLTAVAESCYPTQVVQWQESTDNGVTWNNIPGQTAVTYLRPVKPVGDYLYRLGVAQTGNIGSASCTVFSDALHIAVVKNAYPAVSIAALYPAICIGLPTSFLATPTEGGDDPHYQWLVNGVAAGQDSAGFTTPSLAGGAAVSVVLTSNAVCAVNPVVSSNVVSLPAVAVPVQGVGIDASATAVCADSLVQFIAKPDNGGATPVFQWQVDGVKAGSGPTFSTALLKDGDVVNCIMTGSQTCSQPVSADPGIKMTVYPLPVIQLDSVAIIAGGTSIRLEPVITGDVVTWNWSPVAGLDDPVIAEPLASPVATTTYTLYVVTSKGCHTAGSERVVVYYPLKMPGAFTPNGDGRNDVFRVPPMAPVVIRSFAVYNRFGLRMFYTTDVGAGWDGRYNGTAQPAGAYVWELVFVNPVTKKVEDRKGTVVLVR